MANVDLKSLFTSEKQYTVLQLLNVLIDEVGKSMVKTATINQDVSAGTMTITVILSDDSVVTASTKLNSLTDAEKSLISTLQSQVTANSDGITFTKFVGFEGNETHKGNEIHQGYSSFLGDENHAGTETHKGSETHSGEVSFSNTITSTSIVKADEIDNSAGNAMLRYKSTEDKVVLGGSTKPTVIMGSTTRPYYSADGSDFNGSELALKSDVDSVTSVLYMHNITITYSKGGKMFLSIVSKNSTPVTTWTAIFQLYAFKETRNFIVHGMLNVKNDGVYYPVYAAEQSIPPYECMVTYYDSSANTFNTYSLNLGSSGTELSASDNVLTIYYV